MTIAHDAVNLTGTYSLLVTSGGHHWIHRYLPAQTWAPSLLPHMVGKWAVHILLVCFLVLATFVEVHEDTFFRNNMKDAIFLTVSETAANT